MLEQKRTQLRYRFCDNFTLRTIIARQLRNVAYPDTVDLNVDIGRGSIFITGVNIDVISKRTDLQYEESKADLEELTVPANLYRGNFEPLLSHSHYRQNKLHVILIQSKISQAKTKEIFGVKVDILRYFSTIFFIYIYIFPCN